ncbi:RDD family protein [Marilutibacter aestuarii]|uniref:RDD family protein n=1 Tax=Marilutibacter aestuarii TaxID=1706195 RepID=A0A508AGI2_9GAMM|nr:RDD family protein [Lysobacter aestuarii]TQD47721.1 RDD family protein [Lysobacter aestuarii]
MTQWYYSDDDRNRQGPVDASTLAGLHESGQLAVDALVWREGMAQWQPWRAMAHEVLGPDASAAAPAAPTVTDGMDPYNSAPAPLASPYAPPASTLTDLGGFQAGGEVVYAGFWKRVAAYMIDSFAVGVVSWIVQMVVMAVFFGVSAGALAGDSAGLLAGGVMGILVGMVIVPLALQAVYFAAFHASARQATLGKMAVGIKVTSDDGHRISFARGIGRYFGVILGSLLLYIGLIMAAFTDRKRALHDIMCSTLVVDQWAFTDHPERQRHELGTVATVILVIGGLLVLAYIGLMVLVGFMAAMGNN